MVKLNKFRLKEESRPKTAFYASDYGKPALDLYFGLRGTPKTNPPQWYDVLKMSAGSGAEETLLQTLKDSGFVDEYYDQDWDGRVDFTREGVEIHGYMDAVTLDGEPVEIKTINNKNNFDIRRYSMNEPRENYVGQLAIYLDYLNTDRGWLLVCSIDGLHRFLFECVRLDGKRFKCGEVVVDLENEYKRWSSIYQTFLTNDSAKKQEYLWELRYKYPLEEIDWKTVGKTKIVKARNNQAVIGDWQVQYSNWKDLIIKLQGTAPGYSIEEINKIKEYTAGYTNW